MTRWLVLAGTVWVCALAIAGGQAGRSLFPGMLDQHPAIDYRAGALTDAVSRLQGALAADQHPLSFAGEQGFLRSVLAAFDVPVDSQILLFSKTGIQHPFTNPENPRALYFTDRVIVGYIPGAPVIEIASHDLRQGVVFHTLKQDATGAPQLARPDRCLVCHLSANSLEVPGLLVRSMFTDSTGRTRPQLGSTVVDHRTPIERRWGGWYVTGTHGAARHMGNAMVTDATTRGEDAISERTLNLATLDPRVDASAYPSATSDIVALMVFDHQGRAVNLLTRLGWEARIAKEESRLDVAAGGLRDLIREVADYFLFVDEALLPAPIQGASSFAKAFTAGGVRDSKGRSLRELDLATRLLRYRCSYMVYSPAFTALPDAARAAVIARMKEILIARNDVVASEILSETVAGWR